MANPSVGARVKLDGEKEFRQAISDINAGLRINKSEMELLAAQYSKNADSVEGLSAKGEALNNQIYSQTDKITTLEQALASSTEKYGEADKRTMTWQTSLNQAKAELIKMDGELDNNQKALKKAVTGAADFNDEISKIDATVRANKSEMELLTAQYSKNANSVEALTAKGEALSHQINSQTDKVKKLEQAFNESAQANGKADNRTLEWKVSLNQAKTELIKMTDALEENNMTLGEAQADLSDYDTSVDTTGQKTSKFGSLSSKIFSKLGIDVGEAEQSASGALKDYMEELGITGDTAGKASDIIGGAMEGAPVIGAAAAVAAILKISEAAQKAADEVELSTARMQVSLGLTDEEASAAAYSVNNIYKKGLAENEAEAEQALVSVTKLMKMQGEEAENTANQVIALSRVYGEDIKSTTRTAATLMQQFGLDGQQALDLIAAGLQTSANKNSDLLDVLNEYSPSFDRIGYSAEEFLTKIVAATDAGAYSADKSADVIKEFYNKAASGSQDFADGLKQLGLNSQSMINQVTSGGETAQMAFEKIATKLAGITSESKQAQIASKLFGSQWEDVGTQATLAMTNTKNGILETTGSAEEAVIKLSKTNSVNNDKVTRYWTSNWKEALGIITDDSQKGGEAAGEASSKGYSDTWTSSEKQILDAVQKTANSSNSILSGIGSNINGSSSNSSKQKIPPYALGTAYHSGGFARVNDRQNDPTSGEIIDLPTGSRVYPKGVSPSSGGDIFNITIDAKNVKDFNDIVTMAQAARQQRRSR